MTSIETSPTAIRLPEDDVVIDDAQLAAVAFLARAAHRGCCRGSAESWLWDGRRTLRSPVRERVVPEWGSA
jgi:hypothetical protein